MRDCRGLGRGGGERDRGGDGDRLRRLEWNDYRLAKNLLSRFLALHHLVRRRGLWEPICGHSPPPLQAGVVLIHCRTIPSFPGQA